MARIIQSPGVQITEVDLSLRETQPTGTIVVVPGFASQGPVDEPLFITSVSELEKIYGVPTTPAERYFYNSCKEILNSPGRLNTVRLGYGEEEGVNYTNGYSALFYPMASAVGAVGSGALVDWTIYEPIHVPLSRAAYEEILAGNANWSSFGVSVGPTVVADFGPVGTGYQIDAGFVVLNDLQSVVNEIAEGYYVGIADNSSVAASSFNFDSIKHLNTVTDVPVTGTFSTFNNVTIDRLDFSLSATDGESLRGIYSVSESLEKVGFVAFEKPIYQDYLSFGLFRVRRSVSDHTKLSLGATERYLGSLDSSRKKVSPSGGILETSFIEEMINDGSPTIKLYINPSLSNLFDWTTGGTTPTSRITIDNSAKALFPLGIYVPNSRNADIQKVIGNVPAKLEKALRLLENVENNEIDVIVDAGLSTIYSTCQYTNLSAFDEFAFIPHPSVTLAEWSNVANVLVDFSQNTRKDCFTILDAPRSIFISGKDSKVIDIVSKSFTSDIYNPLKDCASFESNYAALYANWIKVVDVYSGRRFWQPISGAMAAVYCRNDSVSYPWYAPAGVTRAKFNVVDIALNPNQKQKDRLYEISVNPVVYMQSEGYVVMGQKTLQTKPTAFDRINVRRLFLALERSTSKALRPYVFEPNTEFTRTKIKSSILPIMDLAKNTEGLYDYLVICDERNNKTENIENNEVIIDIYIKPVKSAEFILVNFIATRTGQNFAELI